MPQPVFTAEHVYKEYRLGTLGSGTLREDIQDFWARLKHQKPAAAEEQKHKRFYALKDISFSLAQGEALGLIGNNGAGKSTLLKILTKITRPTAGYVKSRGRVSALLEVGTGFHPELTGRENVFLNGAFLGMCRREVAKSFEEIIDFSGISADFIDTPVKRYSSGMYVRLAFSVAAHLNAEILILDEVLMVGDTGFRAKSLKKMEDVIKNQGRTVIFVSHIMDQVKMLCQRCLLLDHGVLLLEGETNTVVNQYLETLGRS
jgi:lipopolysaccharide transport system ATP-binding protein